MGALIVEGLKQRSARLAAAARALKSAGGAAAQRAPFSLAFLSDRKRGPDALLMARTLPSGAALIYRDYDDPRRAARARALKSVCAARGVIFFIGGDAALARAVGADGLHLRSDQLRGFTGGRPRLLSASCHNTAELEAAAAIGADIAFLGPVFATASHPGAIALGAECFKNIAAGAALPVLALGGVDEKCAHLLAGGNVCGLGAIGAFAARPSGQ